MHRMIVKMIHAESTCNFSRLRSRHTLYGLRLKYVEYRLPYRMRCCMVSHAVTPRAGAGRAVGCHRKIPSVHSGNTPFVTVGGRACGFGSGHAGRVLILGSA